MTQDAVTQNSCPKILSPTPLSSRKKPSRKSPRWAAKLPWYCDKFNPVLGEAGLWMAVITQAMMDALSRSTHPEHRYHKEAAIQWLTGNSRDFYLVCSLANLDPGYVRRNAKRALTVAVEWRAAPGKGARYQERKAYRKRLKKPAPAALSPEEGGKK
jgi:hypothetical protein